MATGQNIKRNSRIFHIANECYIIYLGVKTDEEKPFLRIGNMEKIDDKILNVLSNTVIASRFTGNPLYELKLEKSREINYIGDTAVIKRMKTYLNSFHLPSDGAVDYHNVKDREQRDVIYFYNNGNIKLNYKDEPIFDLYKRSESDQHFVRQCDEIKKSFSRNPLRYTKHDFRGSGVLLSGDNLLVFNGSRFFSASLGSDYFSQLASAGIDPDQIDVHYSTIDSHTENEDSSFALIELLKRSSYRNSPFTVHAKDPEYARKIGALFPGARISESGKEWATLFPGLKTRDRGEGLEIQGSGFPSDLVIGGKSPDAESMTLNRFSGKLAIRTEKNEQEIRIPDGILCNLKGRPLSIVDMTDIYISRFIPLIKGFSSEEDYKVSVAIQKMLKMLATVVDGKAKSGLIMRSTVFNFSDLLKDIRLKSDSILTCFLENSLAILDLSLNRSDIDTKIIKNINTVKTDIKSILIKSEKADYLLPVSCDVFTEEFPILLYRSVKSTAKKADYLLAAEIARDIFGEHDLSPQYYNDEKTRLLKLIDMLSSATDLEVDKLLEKQKPAEPFRERQTEIVDNQGSRRDSTPGEQERPGSNRKGLKPSGRSLRGRIPLWLLLLLIPVVLLLFWGGYKGVDYLLNLNGRDVVAVGVGEKGESEKGDGNTSSGVDGDSASDKDTSGDAASGEGTSEDDTSGDAASGEGTSKDDTSGDAVSEEGTSEDDTSGEAVSEEGASEDAATGEGPSEDAIIPDKENNSEKNDSELKLKDSSAETENRENQPEKIVMTTDSRPATADEAKAYLSVGDYFISAIDIHLASNRIAVDNNYRDLDYEIFDGADPNWIYPGNKISLPDGNIHNVIKGDTIWYLAAKYIRVTLDRDIPLFEGNRKEAESGNAKAITVLEEIADSSPCEAFREKIHEVLKN